VPNHRSLARTGHEVEAAAERELRVDAERELRAALGRLRALEAGRDELEAERDWTEEDADEVEACKVRGAIDDMADAFNREVISAARESSRQEIDHNRSALTHVRLRVRGAERLLKRGRLRRLRQRVGTRRARSACPGGRRRPGARRTRTSSASRDGPSDSDDPGGAGDHEHHLGDLRAVLA
jgi:hypothetical protein